jgi:outer membrane biosynthesis protein TonB
MVPGAASAERAPRASAQVARQSEARTHPTRRTSGPPEEPEAAPGTGAPSPETDRPRYQDDIWVLTEEHPGGGGESGRTPPAGSGAPGEPQGASSSDPGAGTGGSGPPSLLGELSARLARSAARCTPAGVVRSSRESAPEVPLHFCLDAAGRPTAVGLEGTTGSELLDRAARECVVPGAAPLPPLPGCYTVAVRFPLRG